MKHQNLYNQVKESVDGVRKILSEMDQDKARHLMDQIAQAGFHEVVKLRKEAQKHVRLLRRDLRKQSKRVLSEAEKLQDCATSKAEEVWEELARKWKRERTAWRGRRRSSRD